MSEQADPTPKTSAEYLAEAERLLLKSRLEAETPWEREYYVQRAQVEATLAHAAALREQTEAYQSAIREQMEYLRAIEERKDAALALDALMAEPEPAQLVRIGQGLYTPSTIDRIRPGTGNVVVVYFRGESSPMMYQGEEADAWRAWMDAQRGQ